MGRAARFYIDEDVNEMLAGELMRLGYDAINTHQAGNKGSRDPRQLSFAAKQGRILVTCNNGDFEMLHQAWQLWSTEWGVAAQVPHAGIVVIPNGREITIAGAARIIDELITLDDPLANRLFRWRQSTGWKEVFERKAED